MKKIYSFIIAFLMAINCSFSQNTDCPDYITDHPWFVDFLNDFDCWQTDGWRRYTIIIEGVGTWYGVGSNDENDLLISPAVVLPNDSTGLNLYWKDKTMYPPAYYYQCASCYCVLISSARNNGSITFDTLFNGYAESSNLIQRSVSLADYAGDTVIIAFKNVSQYNVRNVMITDIAAYNLYAPIATLESPQYEIRVGDTVHYAVNIVQGGDTTLSYSWHSSYFDTTIIGNIPSIDLIYPVEGADTIAVTVSNAYGSLTLRKNIYAFNCNPINSFPWNEDFDALSVDSLYNTCWQLSGTWYHNSFDHNSYNDEDGNRVMEGGYIYTNDNDGSLVTPPIRIPNYNVSQLKLWIQHIGSLTATVSTDGGNNYTDTIYNVIYTWDQIIHQGLGNTLCLRSVPLAQYAGQTIMVKITDCAQPGRLGRVAVYYDTSLRVNVDVPQIAYVDTAVLCTATLRYGDTAGLSFNWHSSVGGIITTNTLGDSAWITYPAGVGSRCDVVYVIASNNYNTDTATGTINVIDCTPAVSLPWIETFAEGIVCWYKPEGSNWIDETYYSDESTRALSSYCYRSSNAYAPQWIMSKAIIVPSDTSLRAKLSWDVASSYRNYQHNYSVWISTSGDYTDTSNYELVYLDTNTHISFPNLEHIQISLSDYAGDTIHIAFRNMLRNHYTASKYLYIDNVTVRLYLAPVAAINVPGDIYTGDAVCNAEATLLEGTSSGLNCYWHSSFLDTSVNGWLFPLSYTSGGTDTLTFIVSNNYGSDTLKAIVQIHNCPAIAVPFEEPFEMADTYVCWRDWNLLSDPNPNYNYDWSMELIDGRSAMAMTSFISGPFVGAYNSWLVTPAIAIPAGADGLNLDLDVKGFYNLFSDSSSLCSRLKVLVSYAGGAGPEYFSDTVYDGLHIGEWIRIHIPLDDYAGQTVNIAFVNDAITRYLYIDSLRIGYTYLPQVAISHNDAYVGDTTTFIAVTNNCVSDNLNIEWHSSLLNTTFQPGFDTLDIIYPNTGIDTITLVYSNLYGADTAVAVFEVLAHPLPVASIVAPLTAVAGDTVNLVATINDCSHNGLYYGWHSSLLGVTVNDTVWSFVYPDGGMDTVTFVVSNIFGSDSASASYYVYNCNAAVLPYYETFEYVSTDGYSVPNCWSSYTNGGAGSSVPHVTHGFPSDNIPDNALRMFAGNNTAYGSYGTIEQVVLPRFNRPLQELSLSLDYMYADVNKGELIIGSYNDSLNLFTPFDTLTPHSGTYASSTINFSTSTADSNDHIVIRWTQVGPATTLFVDNVLVRRLPYVTIGGPSTVAIGDNAPYSVSVTELTDIVTSISWHSAFQSRGDASMQLENGNMSITYNVEGVDTLSVTITTNIDTVTAFYSVNVVDMRPVAVIQMVNSGTLCDTIMAVVNYEHFKDVYYDVRWYSRMAESGLATLIPAGDTLRMVYQIGGFDTITAVVENVYGSDSVWHSIQIGECDTIWRMVSADVVMLGGSETPDGLSILGTGIYPDGTMATLTAQYPDDITFVYWITPEGDTIGSNPYSFMVNDDITILAVFDVLTNVFDVQNIGLSIFPNPAKTAVTVEVPLRGTLTVLDMSGREILSLNLSQGRTTFNVSQLITGVYFLRFVSSEGSCVSKLMVTRP